MSISVANSRVRLSRDQLHQLRWLLGLVLVLLAFWTLFGLEFGGVFWRVLFLVTAASALVFPAWPGRIPVWLRRWSLIFGGAILFTQFIATQFDIMSGLVLLVSLLALSRALEYRRLREDWHLILLCLFIIVLSGVLTLSLLFGLQILIFTIVTMALLFVMNLLQRDAARALQAEDWKNFHWPKFLRQVRQALDLRQLLLSGVLFAGLVAVSTVIFISIPRFQFDQSFSFAGVKGVAGFHDDIHYNAANGIASDNSIVLRVDVPDGVSFTSPPYWRMIVLDEYKDNGFHVSSLLQHSEFPKKISYAPNAHRKEAGTELGKTQYVPGTWKFYLEGNVSEYLPVLGPFDTLTFNTSQSFWPNEEVKVYRTELPSSKAMGYEVQEMDFGKLIPAAHNELAYESANWSLATVDERRRQRLPIAYPFTCFGLPFDAKNPGQKTRDRETVDNFKDQILATVAQAKGVSPGAVARDDYLNGVIKHLAENHVASLDMDLTGKEKNGDDVLVRWMNTPHSPGWCEFYAGSFVLLARAAGYPARVVAGYKGASLNTSASQPYYLVRQNFAHAWAEVFDREKGEWERWDPSPGADFTIGDLASGEANAGITQESGWGAFLDNLRMIWYRRVINFDQTDQQELAQQVGDYGKSFAATVGEWFKNGWEEFTGWFNGPMTPTRYATLTGALLALALAWWRRTQLRNLWLRLSGWLLQGRAHRLAPVRGDAGRWLRRFLPVWQALAPVLPGAERAQWEGVRRDLLALRYGPLEGPVNPAETFRKARTLLKRRTLNIERRTSNMAPRT